MIYLIYLSEDLDDLDHDLSDLSVRGVKRFHKGRFHTVSQHGFTKWCLKTVTV